MHEHFQLSHLLTESGSLIMTRAIGPAVILLHGGYAFGMGRFGDFESILPILKKMRADTARLSAADVGSLGFAPASDGWPPPKSNPLKNPVTDWENKLSTPSHTLIPNHLLATQAPPPSPVYPISAISAC